MLWLQDLCDLFRKRTDRTYDPSKQSSAMTSQADPSRLFIFPEIPLVSPGPARDSSLGGGVYSYLYALICSYSNRRRVLQNTGGSEGSGTA